MRRTVSRENISTISALLCDLHCLEQVKDGYKELQELGLISLSCFSNTVDSVSCNKVLYTLQVIKYILCSIKIVLFQDNTYFELPQGEVFSERNSKQQITKLIHFV